jgi:hypothetical protein
MSIGNVTQSISNIASNAQSYLNNNVNTFVSPKNAKGLCGWVFDVEKETNIKLQSDVTDNYTESGSYINDHIVNKPIEITLTGYIGELVYVRPDPYSVRGLQRQLQNKLTTVSAYLGKYTPQAYQQIQDVVNTADYIESSINQKLSMIQNINSFFQGEVFQETKQKKAYRELYAYWIGHNGEKLLTVQTPFDFYENMVITSLSFTQGEDSVSYSDISITLKQLRFAELGITTYNGENFVNTDVQKGKTADNGNTTTDPRSFYKQAYDNGKGLFGH